MEAAGIEPASRDMSAKASTCVAAALNFADSDVRRQTSDSASRELVLTAGVPGVTQRRSGIGYQLLGLSGESPQPVLTI